MIEALAGFLEALRARGLTPSPAEAIDAARALAAVGVESRREAEAALGAALAKDRRAQAILREEFARYFRAPARTPGGHRGEPAGTGTGGGSGRSPAETAPVSRPTARPPGRPGAPHRGIPPPVSTRGPRAAATGPPLVASLRDRAGRSGQRLRRVVTGGARPEVARVEGAGRAAPGAREALARLSLRGRHDVATDDRLIEEAARLLAMLRLEESRRRRAARRGTLALRRTLRKSLRTGGVPFAIARSRRRRLRPRIAVLLDVSRSCERASGLFFVALAASLLEAAGTVRIFAFVDRPVDCTRALSAWSRGGHPAGLAAPPRRFHDLVAGLAGLDLEAPSDYGRAFHALGERGLLRGGGRERVLLVLGDGRTNRFPPLGWAFAELARRSRRVVWLVPEPAAEWGTGDSALGDYLPSADLAVETSDLGGLVRGARVALKEARR